jgi:hypothetical protein
LMMRKGVKLCGFGIPGQGFYSLNVELSDMRLLKPL